MAELIGNFGTKPLEILGQRPPEPNVVPKGQTTSGIEAEDKALYEYPTVEPIEVTKLQYAELEGAMASGKAPEEALAALQDIGLKQEQFNNLLAKGETLSYSDILNSQDPEVTAQQFKVESRRQKALSKLYDLAEQYTGGTTDSVVEFADSFVYDSIRTPAYLLRGAMGEGTWMTADSQEWVSALSQMSDEEFDAYLNTKLADLQDPASLVSFGGNAWPVFDQIAALDGAGYVAYDKEFGLLNVGGSLLGAGDTARLGMKVGKKAMRGLNAIGKTAIERVAAMRGIEEATEVAVKAMPDGVAHTAAVAEDILPTALKPPTRQLPNPSSGAPMASTAHPTVNQASLITKTKTNRIYEYIKTQFNKGAYGFTDWTENADAWAMARAKSIAQMHSPNLVDYDVISSVATHEDFLTYRMTATFGKAGGNPWTSFNSAKKWASELGVDKTPEGKSFQNGLSTTVIDAKTGMPVTKGVPGGKYYVVSEERRQIKPEALDLSKVKAKNPLHNAFANWFGVTGMNGDELINALAFSMDAGGAKTRFFIGEEFSKAAKVAGKEQINRVASIIESARDSGIPNKSWMSNADFVNQYVSTYGHTPPKGVIQFYELAQEASDAAWMLKAHEGLKHLTNRNVIIYTDKKGIEHKIYPFHGDRDTIQSKVLNVSTGAKVDKSAIPKEQSIYVVLEQKNGVPTYMTNVVGKTRLPEFTDALPYRPYGSRSNPEVSYFVGTLTTEGWNTTLGARSAEQGKKATEAINKIASYYKSLGKNFDPLNPTQGLTQAEILSLDNLIKANNEWNPNIESWVEYVEFMNGRKVDPLGQQVYKPRNAHLATEELYADQFILYKNMDDLITYSRHDEALVEYGGKNAFNPNPIHAIVRQTSYAADQIANLQYRVEHVGRWDEAVRNAMNPKNPDGSLKQAHEIIDIDPGSDHKMFAPEVRARNLVIKGNSKLAAQLRQEQQAIVKRLDMIEGSSSESSLFKGVRDTWTKSANWAIESLVDSKLPMGLDERKLTRGIAGLRDNTSGRLLGFGFLTKMTSPSTAFVQAAAIIPISMVSPKNATRAVVLTGYMRELMRHPQGPSLLAGLRKGIAKMAGLSDQDMQLLLDHLETSGRGFARGSIVEDPHAVPGIKSKWGKTKDVLSIPFYAGENFSQMASRITAYLDVLDKTPSLKSNPRLLWKEVAKRDQALSINMNASSAGMMSKDSTARVISQWRRFVFNSINTVLFDDKLTGLERAKLGASLTILWGWAAMGLPNNWFESDAESTWVTDLLKYGPIDLTLRETLGVTIGDRVGINLWETFSTLVSGDPEKIVPFVKNQAPVTTAIWNAGYYFFSGQAKLGAMELARLVRVAKVIDDGWMAYTMYMNNVRESNSANGVPIKKDWTGWQEFAQAMGFKPEEVNELFRMSKFQKSVKDRQKTAVDNALPYVKQAIEAGEAQDWEAYGEYMKDAAAVVDSYDLPPSFRMDAVNTVINYAGNDRMTSILLNCVEAGCQGAARDFAEGLK